MTASPITVARVAALKLEAAEVMVERNCKRAAALKILAEREGYRSWMALVAQAGNSNDVRRAIRFRGLPTQQKPFGR